VFNHFSISGKKPEVREVGHIVWKRPCELRKDPHLFKDGVTRFDINQVFEMFNNERVEVAHTFLKLLIYCQKLSKNFKTFDLVPKKTFDLLPNLRETFDLLKRSSEIRSSDQLPIQEAENG
jgi:hypothetical protein